MNVRTYEQEKPIKSMEQNKFHAQQTFEYADQNRIFLLCPPPSPNHHRQQRTPKAKSTVCANIILTTAMMTNYVCKHHVDEAFQSWRITEEKKEQEQEQEINNNCKSYIHFYFYFFCCGCFFLLYAFARAVIFSIKISLHHFHKTVQWLSNEPQPNREPP